MEKLTVNVKEAAKMIGLSEKGMYTLAHRADFPAVRVGSRILIPVEGLKEWLNAHAGEVVV